MSDSAVLTLPKDYSVDNGMTAGTLVVSNEASLNVKDYGAVGDLTTDDTDAIQAAIDDAKDRKLPLRFPYGQYRITDTLVIYRVAGFQIWGSGLMPSDAWVGGFADPGKNITSAIVWDGNDTDEMLYLNEAFQVEIRNLAFVGKKSSTEGNRAKIAILFEGDSGWPSSGLRATNVWFCQPETAFQAGTSVDEGNNDVCTFYSCTFDQCKYGLHLAANQAVGYVLVDAKLGGMDDDGAVIWAEYGGDVQVLGGTGGAGSAPLLRLTNGGLFGAHFLFEGFKVDRVADDMKWVDAPGTGDFSFVTFRDVHESGYNATSTAPLFSVGKNVTLNIEGCTIYTNTIVDVDSNATDDEPAFCHIQNCSIRGPFSEHITGTGRLWWTSKGLNLFQGGSKLIIDQNSLPRPSRNWFYDYLLSLGPSRFFPLWEERTDTVVWDLASGFSIAALAATDVQYDQAGLIPAAGSDNSSIYLNGTDAFLGDSDLGQLRLELVAASNNTWTLLAFYRHVSSGTKLILSDLRSSADADQKGFELGVDSSNHVYFKGAVNSTTINTTTGSTTLQVGSVYFIAATGSSGANATKVYVNGVLDGSGVCNNLLVSENVPRIGSSPYAGGYYPMYLQCMAMFDSVLDATAIATIYQKSMIWPVVSAMAAGTAYSLTTTAAALSFGTTNPAITLTQAGVYRIRGRVNLQYNGATFAANRTVTFKLRRTNNTAADLSNGSSQVVTGVVTTFTGTLAIVELEADVYVTANTDDAITIFGSINTAPSAGSLDCVEARVDAVRIG